jgi:type III pantothenate kinase
VNLIIDIGNTNAKLLAYSNGKPVEEVRSEGNTLEQLVLFCRKYRFDKGIYSSVINLSVESESIIKKLPFEVINLQSGITPVPIKNMYASPQTLGSDRLAAVVGANFKYPDRDILIIDIGTCITYDFINARGEYLGGNISPGPSMRLKALNRFTDRLPLISRHGDIPEVGNNTETAIRSGVMMGVEYEIEGYIKRFRNIYPQLLVYLTGGVQLNLHISEKSSIFADKFIVPDGLNRILEYNNE